ncbi:MAG: CPBP family intramembrane metalloprotease [Lachnospiraceae bacterium]|nr:CPBP family intramembrane metalloprotease [Lachnospiraceae bacterium]
MFAYYFLHSLWNQLKQFVRSWAFVLFALMAFAGSVIWMWGSWYYRRLAEENPALPEDFSEFFTVSGLSGLDALELAAGLFVLGLLLFQAVSAEKSVSRLFMQSDVNLLFASDRSPQEVLAFRVTNTLALGIIAGAVILFRLPSIASAYALTPYAAAAIFISWMLLLAFSVLLKILIYEIGSRHPVFHRNLRWFLFAGFAVFAVFFYRADKANDKDLLLTARQFFNAPATRWIPVWGWIKGVLMFALEGDGRTSLGLLVLSLCVIAALGYLALKLPANYYEETLTYAQEAAMLAEAVGNENAALLVMGSRRHREVKKAGFRYGKGSSVYFFRVLHNRARSSRHFVTKTMLTYLFAEIAAGLYVRYFLEEPIDYIPVLLLVVIVFFRTIISPVTEDVRMAGFLLQPEPVWHRLFFSLLGGSCNCALDAALPLMAGSLAAGFSPLRGLMYLPVLAAVDFFASASGVFTDVSIPTSIGVSFKQVIQVLLIYAGLIFDGLILSYGIATRHSAAGFALMTLLNLLFGGTFLGLTGVWLYPCKGKRVRSEGDLPDEAGAKRVCSRIGFALSAMFLAIFAGQRLLTGAFPVLGLYLPIYGIGFPLFLLFMGPGKTDFAKGRPLRFREFLLLVPACFFVMYGGNILGYLLQGIVGLIPFSLGLAPLGSSDGGLGLQAALLVLAAPLMEEYVFRRCVMDRLLPYGEKAALAISALLFALFHGAVNQFCYAFLLGLVFGYVYLKTRRLRYTIALHVLINSLSAIVLPLLLLLAARSAPGIALNQVELSSVITNPGVMALLLYLLLLLVLTLLGSVLFFHGFRERDLSADGVGPKTAFSSRGLLVFLFITGTVLLFG